MVTKFCVKQAQTGRYLVHDLSGSGHGIAWEFLGINALLFDTAEEADKFIAVNELHAYTMQVA
jgi:hypothetical protein